METWKRLDKRDRREIVTAMMMDVADHAVRDPLFTVIMVTCRSTPHLFLVNGQRKEDAPYAAAPNSQLDSVVRLRCCVADKRWFLTTMGTGIVAILIHQLPYQFRGLYEISVVFLILNVIIFLTLLVLSIIRYTVWPEIFLLMLRHPVQSLFLYFVQLFSAKVRGAVPMGLATIITMLVYVAVPLSKGFLYFVQVLFWIDVVLSLLTCFGVPLFMYFPLH